MELLYAAEIWGTYYAVRMAIYTPPPRPPSNLTGALVSKVEKEPEARMDSITVSNYAIANNRLSMAIYPCCDAISE